MMKFKKILNKASSKILQIALLCFFLFVFKGCSKEVVDGPSIVVPPPPRPPGSPTDNKEWKQTEFILSSFFALPGSGNATDYRTILNRTKAAGLNRVELTFLSKEALEIALNVAEEVGIRTIAQDVKSFSGIADASPELIKSEIVARVEYLKRFSMLDGYFVWDEPFEKDFEKVKAINAILKEADPSRLAYSVIFPSYGMYNWSTGAYTWDDNSYTRYVNGYLDKVNPEIFSFDYYPYRTNVASVNIIENDMWRDFGYIRKITIAREKKLWCYIQAINLIAGQTSIINLERIRAQMYGALAYGVKGLSYYNSYGSLLNDVFEKTAIYDDLTSLNNDVKNIGNVLFDKRAEKLYHTGELITEQLRAEYFLDKFSESELFLSAPKDLILGVFSDGSDGKYLLVSNKSHTNTVNGEIALKGIKKITAFEKRTNTKKIVSASASKFQINLLPGEGELYQIN